MYGFFLLSPIQSTREWVHVYICRIKDATLFLFFSFSLFFSLFLSFLSFSLFFSLFLSSSLYLSSSFAHFLLSFLTLYRSYFEPGASASLWGVRLSYQELPFLSSPSVSCWSLCAWKTTCLLITGPEACDCRFPFASSTSSRSSTSRRSTFLLSCNFYPSSQYFLSLLHTMCHRMMC